MKCCSCLCIIRALLKSNTTSVHQMETSSIVSDASRPRSGTCLCICVIPIVSGASRPRVCWGIWMVRAHLKGFSDLAGNHTNAQTCSWFWRSVLQTAWCFGKCYQLWKTDPGLSSIGPEMQAYSTPLFRVSILWSNQEKSVQQKKSVFHFTCVTCFDLSSLLIKFFWHKQADSQVCLLSFWDRLWVYV